MVLDTEFSQKLNYDYVRYRESSFNLKNVKHSEILSFIGRLQDKNIFSVNKAGESEEGRSINIISCGEGPTKIFLWSQMHGDESTATKAIFDVLNFLGANDDFNPCRKKFFKKLTIYFMPMVNPDGAERIQRENAFNIDINRDLLRKQSVESRILYDAFKEINPDFAFNLHDQERIYTAGLSNKSAAISFLAPAYNYRKDINRVRTRAMKLISMINEILSQFVPGHTAKYSDEFEPRAFGDNFQKLGASTILIESGNWINDNNKQYIRKLNFIALLYAFKNISERSYRKAELNSYFDIPNNEKYMLDLVIRNIKYKSQNKEYKLDIGITRKEIFIKGAEESYYESNIEELGDLSVFHGYEDYDFEGYTVWPGKIYPDEFVSVGEIKNLDYTDLYKHGYLFVKLNRLDISSENYNIPINILLNKKIPHAEFLKTGMPSNFYLVRNSKIRYVVINGFLFNLFSNTGEMKNGTTF